MLVVPLLTPVNTPVPDIIEPTPGALLVQAPPAGASVSVMLLPTHTVPDPFIAPGSGLIVTTTVGAAQPFAEV